LLLLVIAPYSSLPENTALLERDKAFPYRDSALRATHRNRRQGKETETQANSDSLSCQEIQIILKMSSKKLLWNYLVTELGAAMSVIACILEMPAGPLMPKLSTRFSLESTQRENVKSM